MASPTCAREPAGCGEFVLYLDYDGVLHHEGVYWSPKLGAHMKAAGFRLFEHAALLAGLLEPYPSCRIVLSTSWVRQYTCEKAAKRLPQALCTRVIGATFHSEMNEGAFLAKPRGQQVRDDIHRRQPRDWLALDDDLEGWTDSMRNKVVFTHKRLGISEPTVLAEFRAKLALMYAQCGAE